MERRKREDGEVAKIWERHCGLGMAAVMEWW